MSTQTWRHNFAAAMVVLALGAMAACGGDWAPHEGADDPTPTDGAPSVRPESGVAGVVVVAVGDIACSPASPSSKTECRHTETAALVAELDPDVVTPLGDLQYERGEAAGFDASYLPTWGAFLDRTHAAPGNHEYAGGRLPGYFDRLGRRGGQPGAGTPTTSAGGTWWSSTRCVLRSAAAAPEVPSWRGSKRSRVERPTLHAGLLAPPRWSSGLHGSDAAFQPFWDALSAAGADVVLSGHDHHYERFAPIQGIRQFVVGTGGRSLYPVIGREKGSEFVDARHFGALRLRLGPGGYDWTFFAVSGSAGGAAVDEGSRRC